MVAENTVRKYGVNQVFGFVEGTWSHRKSRQIIFSFMRAQHVLATILYK